MVTNIGQPSEFDPQTESIVAYIERMWLIFRANDIKAPKQVPVLLLLIGCENYSLLRDLMSLNLTPRSNLRWASNSFCGTL